MDTTVFRKVAALAILSGMAVTARGTEPGWTGSVIKRGADRAAMDALPITERPYRPLHFYGNTVRRLHYRGQALPAPRDLTEGIRALRTER